MAFSRVLQQESSYKDIGMPFSLQIAQFPACTTDATDLEE